MHDSMPEGLFNQPFVYCGVCHRNSTKEDPLYLTSCAHTLCSQHLNNRTCPICATSDTLVIKLVENKQLPDDIKILFQPIPNVLENLYNVSQFQITGLVNQCQYYQEHCMKLREKCARQRQLLFQAKQELDSVAKLKSRVAELESMLKRRSDSITGSASSVFTETKPPDTVDLTLDESSMEENEESFIKKLKTTSSLRNKLMQPLRHMPTSANSIADKSYTANSAIAESTQLSRYISTPGSQQEKGVFSSSSAAPPPPISAAPVAPSSTRLKGNTAKSQLHFPSALEKLRLVKRNHTYNSADSPSRGVQGLTPHMRSSSSSSRGQTQIGMMLRKNSTSHINVGSQSASSGSPATNGNNNKFRRIR